MTLSTGLRRLKLGKQPAADMVQPEFEPKSDKRLMEFNGSKIKNCQWALQIRTGQLLFTKMR